MKMKSFKRQVKTWLFLLFLSPVLLSGCKDSDENGTSYDPNKPVVVDNFYPTDGGVGTKLIIRGSNFGNDVSKVKVFIQNDDTKQAKVVNVCDTRIYAVVPPRAGTGKVSVTVGEEDQAQNVTTTAEFLYEFRQNVSTLCGGGTSAEIKDGKFSEALFMFPSWLILDDDPITGENKLYVFDSDINWPKTLRVLDLDKETCTTAWIGAGSKTCTMEFTPDKDTILLGIQGNPSTAFLTRDKDFTRQGLYYTLNANSNAATMNPIDREIFVNDYYTGHNLRVNKNSKTSETMFASSTRVTKTNSDWTFCWSLDGKTLFSIVRESINGGDGCIMRMDYDLATKALGEPSVWVGAEGINAHADGQGTEARFNRPNQMVAALDGNYYVADRENHCIRKITADGVVTTIAGQPGKPGFTEGDPLKEAQFNIPRGVAVSADGSTVYVADAVNRRICKIVVE